MSSIANWSYTSTATIWPKGSQDEFGDFSWGDPYTVKASWMRGGKDRYTDNHGIEFTPMITVWTELVDVASGSVAATPANGDMIATGTHTSATPVATAYAVRAVREDDMSAFCETKNDFEIVC